jgi:hypothetical protein
MSVNVCTSSDTAMVSHRQKSSFHWDWFAKKVLKLRTYEEAVDFLPTKHPYTSVVNRLFANLSLFVHTLSIPDDVNWEEVVVYLELLGQWRQHSSDLFPPGALESAEDHLSRALSCLLRDEGI